MEKVDLVYDPEIAEEYRREQAQKKANAAEQAQTEAEAWEQAREKMLELLKHPERDPDFAQAIEERPDPHHVGENFINGKWVKGQVTAIRLETGEFYRDRRAGTIDWRSDMGEEISLLPCDWEKLAEEIPLMMEILGEA